MIITNIELKNWKNFADVNVACGKRMFLIGPNASGKSNFLDALRFLRDVAQDGLEKAILARGGISAVRYLNARKQSDITVAVTLDDVWQYSLTFGAEKGKSVPLVQKETVYTRNESASPWKTILKRPSDEDSKDALRLTQTALQQVNANVKFREVVEFFSSIQYRHILPQLVREPKAFSPNPISNDPYGRDLVQSIWNASKRTRSRLGKINEALKVAVPQLENLTVKQDKNGIPHFEVNYTHWRARGAYQSESSFSDGTLRLLALLWSILDTGGPLLLEEPELSLHEEIVAQLPSIFSRMDRDKKKAIRQVFITTHAEAMLRDPGIGANEILRFEPDREGTQVLLPESQEITAIQRGDLTVADLLLPKTRPANVERLRLF